MFYQILVLLDSLNCLYIFNIKQPDIIVKFIKVRRVNYFNFLSSTAVLYPLLMSICLNNKNGL